MSKKRLTISLSEEVFRELEEEAKKAGLNKSAFLTTLIKNQNQRKVS
ncbi:ribbon-helix-helix protein, CopG family [Streptococcus hyovaginalis]